MESNIPCYTLCFVVCLRNWGLMNHKLNKSKPFFPLIQSLISAHLTRKCTVNIIFQKQWRALYSAASLSTCPQAGGCITLCFSGGIYRYWPLRKWGFHWSLAHFGSLWETIQECKWQWDWRIRLFREKCLLRRAKLISLDERGRGRPAETTKALQSFFLNAKCGVWCLHCIGNSRTANRVMCKWSWLWNEVFQIGCPKSSICFFSLSKIH